MRHSSHNMMKQTADACAGCGETPYAKLLPQLFGTRVYWANGTGCSQTFPENAKALFARADADAKERYERLKSMTKI